jgi:hypothetical protein
MEHFCPSKTVCHILSLSLLCFVLTTQGRGLTKWSKLKWGQVKSEPELAVRTGTGINIPKKGGSTESAIWIKIYI